MLVGVVLRLEGLGPLVQLRRACVRVGLVTVNLRESIAGGQGRSPLSAGFLRQRPLCSLLSPAGTL